VGPCSLAGRSARPRNHPIIAFGNRLDPEIFSLVLTIEDEIEGIWNLVIPFFDVIGVPDSELRAKKPHGEAVADKQAMERVIAKDVMQILESCALVLEWLNRASSSEIKPLV
jgi:hypothetical protein